MGSFNAFQCSFSVGNEMYLREVFLERKGCYWETGPSQWGGGRLFIASAKFFFTEMTIPETKSRKIVPKVGIEPSLRGLQMGQCQIWGRMAKVGFLGQKQRLRAKKQFFVFFFYTDQNSRPLVKSESKHWFNQLAIRSLGGQGLSENHIHDSWIWTKFKECVFFLHENVPKLNLHIFYLGAPKTRIFETKLLIAIVWNDL